MEERHRGGERLEELRYVVDFYCTLLLKYRGMIGQETMFGTIVTEKTVILVEERLQELLGECNVISRRLLRKN